MLPIAFFLTDPRCHGNEIWDKIGYNSACVRDILRDFCAYKGVFGDKPSNAANCVFFPIDPRWHGNEIWDKISYNSACVTGFCEIFAPIGGLSKMGHQMLPIAFFFERPPLPWQRNLEQNGL